MEKGSFQKIHSLLESSDSRDSKESPDCGNKGESNHFLEILENLEILESFERYSPVKDPFRNDPFSGPESHVYLSSVQQMVYGEHGRGVSPDTAC